MNQQSYLVHVDNCNLKDNLLYVPLLLNPLVYV